MRYVSLLLCLVIFACARAAFAGEPCGCSADGRRCVTACSFQAPVKVDLSAAEASLLGKVGVVTATVTVDYNLPDARLEIQLPTEGEVLDPPIVPLGDMTPSAPVVVSFRVRFSTLGNKFVRAVVRSVQRPGMVWSDVDSLALNIGKERSRLGLDPTEPQRNAEMIFPGDGWLASHPTRVAGSLTAPDSPAPAPACRTEDSTAPLSMMGTLGMITVSGSWSFYDRDDVLTPQRYNQVILRRGNDKTTLATTYTNWAGEFTFPEVANPGNDGVYVSCRTYTDYGGGNKFYVIPPNGWESLAYSYDSAIYKFLTDGSHSIGSWSVPLGEPNRKAWWIQDDMYKAYDVPPDYTGEHCARWSPTNEDGTYYAPDWGIYMLADDVDDTPDIVLHEMGHSVMYNIYGNYFPDANCPSPHSLNVESNVTCAWTEGWATAFAMWVTDDPVANAPGGYALDLEAPTWETPYWDDGSDVEGRVAGALWDITDSVNDGFDTFDGSWLMVWDVMWNVNCDSFGQFWNAWKDLGWPTDGPIRCIWQNTIDYNNRPSCPIPNCSTDEDTPMTIDLWDYASDDESPNSSLTFHIIGHPDSRLGLSIRYDRYLDIDPASNWWTGPVSVGIECSDGLESRNDYFTITINPVNDPPYFYPRPVPDIRIREDTFCNVNLWQWVRDIETPLPNLFTYTIRNSPDPNFGISIESNRFLRVAPAPNWNGETDVVLRVTDTGGEWVEHTIAVNVMSVNDLPVISELPDIEVRENTYAFSVIDLWDYTSDVETLDSGLTFDIGYNQNPSCGIYISSNRFVSVTPVSNWFGYSRVAIRVRDADGGVATSLLNVRVFKATPPLIGALPNVCAETNVLTNNAIDLWRYTRDEESPDNLLTFTITENSNPNCGVSIDSNRYIDVNPVADWMGCSFVRVRATDPTGLWSDDWFYVVVGKPFDNITEARANPDGTWVLLRNKTITWGGKPSGGYKYAGSFYIGEANRSSGILVNGDNPGRGHLVTVAGELKTTGDAERYVYAYSVNSLGSSPVAAPLYMPNYALGGASPDADNISVPEGATGLYTIGQYVRTTGRVIGYAPGELEMFGFYITDGSGVIDNPSGQPSVYVEWLSTPPDIGSYVSVTGALSARMYNSKPMRVIWPWDESDVEVLE